MWCAGLVRSETAAQARSAFLFLDRLSTVFCTFKLQRSTFSLTSLLVVSTQASRENLSTTTELDVCHDIGFSCISGGSECSGTRRVGTWSLKDSEQKESHSPSVWGSEAPIYSCVFSLMSLGRMPPGRPCTHRRTKNPPICISKKPKLVGFVLRAFPVLLQATLKMQRCKLQYFCLPLRRSPLSRNLACALPSLLHATPTASLGETLIHRLPSTIFLRKPLAEIFKRQARD